ncbi:MAG: hypothetical protein WBF58_22045 [Xanthobacteraceae bacterium]
MNAAVLHGMSAPAADIGLLAWLNQAEPGDIIEYHRGFLALDRSFSSPTLTEDDRIVLDRMASLAMRLSDGGLVHLVQRRVASERFAYLAVARRRDCSLAQFLEAE